MVQVTLVSPLIKGRVDRPARSYDGLIPEK